MAILPWKKVNYATKLWKGDCDIPFWVYIETVFPVILHMWFRYITWGRSDLLRMALGKNQSKWTRRLFKGSEKYRARYNFKGLRHYWRIDGIVQRLFFAWLITDILMDGYYRFTTLVHQSGNCDPGLGGGVLMRESVSDITFIANTGWGAYPYPILIQNTAEWLDSAVDVNLPPGNYQAILAMTMKVHESEPGEVIDMDIRLELETGVGPQTWAAGTVTVGPDPQDFLVSANFTVPAGDIRRLHWSQHGDRNLAMTYTKGDLLVSREAEIAVIE